MRLEVNKPAILYMIRNKITDDFYIGITSKKLEHRWCAHISNSKVENPKYYLHRAIKKYGKDNFIWTKIGGVENYKEGLELEKHLIDTMSPSYNITEGGSGILGYKHTDETKKILSERGRGKKRSVEFCKRISEIHLGRRRSDETRKRISEARKNPPEEVRAKIRAARARQTFSEETRKKLSDAGKGRKHSQETIEKMRKVSTCKKSVMCITDGKTFDSVSSAARFYGVSSAHLSDVCAKKPGRKSIGGKLFEYLGEA